METAVGEHLEHLLITAEYVSGELLDSARARELAQVFQQ